MMVVDNQSEGLFSKDNHPSDAQILEHYEKHREENTEEYQRFMEEKRLKAKCFSDGENILMEAKKVWNMMKNDIFQSNPQLRKISIVGV